MNTFASGDIPSVRIHLCASHEGTTWLEAPMSLPTDATTPARTLNPENLAPSRERKARHAVHSGLERARRALAAPSRALRVRPAPRRPKFTLEQFNMLRVYAHTRFQTGIGDRGPFEEAHRNVGDRDRLLDIADILLMAVREVEQLRELSRGRRRS